MRSMELSGHKDHKPPPIYLGDVFSLPCVVLHCSLLSSLGELFVQQVLCIVNCHMRLCSCINNEQFCTHRHCDSCSNNIYHLFSSKKCSEEFYLASADKMYQVGRDLIFLPGKSRISHSCDCSENILVT